MWRQTLHGANLILPSTSGLRFTRSPTARKSEGNVLRLRASSWRTDGRRRRIPEEANRPSPSLSHSPATGSSSGTAGTRSLLKSGRSAEKHPDGNVEFLFAAEQDG